MKSADIGAVLTGAQLLLSMVETRRAARNGNGSAHPAPRMTFPCHVTIHLRSGGVLETDGKENGASGARIEDQAAVVSAKFDAVREAAEMPSAWKRKPRVPAASSN